jgi:hypothetical protein
LVDIYLTFVENKYLESNYISACIQVTHQSPIPLQF